METTQENNEHFLEELKQNTDISNTERTTMYARLIGTNVVHMPLDIWNELFDRLPPFKDNRKLTGSTSEKERIISSDNIFWTVFDTDYPARVWNHKRTAIPRAPIIVYHHSRRGISGCVCKFRFRTYDENMNELMEMRSRVHGESRILRNTREMIARQSLVNLSETSSQ